MPEISRFFGIVIRMFFEAGGPHHRPHFHAYHGEHVGIYAVDTIERMAGYLPSKQERLVLAWAEIHRDALREDWTLLQAGRSPMRIEPLR